MNPTYAKALAAKLIKEEVAVKQELILEQASIIYMNKLIDRSPVGLPDEWKYVPKGYLPGHFMANWHVTTQTSVPDEVDGLDPTKSSRGELKAKIRELVRTKKLKKIKIVNSASYAQAIEEGSAIHNEAAGITPLAFMALTRNEAPEIWAEAVRQVGKL